MSRTRRIPAFVHDNGLLLACLGLFAVFFVGMVVSGAAAYNQEQQEHGSPEQISVLRYLTTGDFVEATFENWESEFLQMGMYVVLTAFLYQKGSSESKPMNGPAPQDQDPREAPLEPVHAVAGTQGWPGSAAVRALLGDRVFRVVLRLLGIACDGRREAFNDEQLQHGQPAISVWHYVITSQFWFESMQNWQSEFIAVAAIVGLSIFLRQRGSAESKPVAEAHRRTSA